MIFRVLTLFCILILSSCDSTNNNNPALQTIMKSDLLPGEMQGEKQLEKEVLISPNTRLMATIDESSKGNGSLKIANLDLKIIDEHDDGEYYENGMLNTEFTDLDLDGFQDLRISGNIIHSGEKGEILGNTKVAFLYRYDPFKSGFVCIYHTVGYSIELNK